MAITTINATMQVRQGLEENLDVAKLRVGEWALSTDNRYIRMCVANGVALRMATYEAFETDMAKIEKILADCEDIQDAVEEIKEEIDGIDITVESWVHGGTGTRTGEDTDNGQYYYEQSKAEAVKSATSETNAKKSETNASNSEKNALTYSTNAKTSENNAKTYSTNAKSSETKAATSETNAKASETKAKSSETNAKTSETNAKTSETNASTSEGVALASATTCQSYVADALTYSNNAKDSEDKAKASEDNAKDSEDNAKVSETNAKASEDNAKESETKAKTSEDNAKASETTASGYKDQAEGFKNSASTYADNSSASATTSEEKALISEGWACGTQNGTEVEPTSPYYHNNSKYYKDQAQSSAFAQSNWNETVTTESSYILNKPFQTIGANLSVDSNGVLSADAQSITVDSELSDTSENPVQNKVIKGAIDSKADASSVPTKTSDLTNDSDYVVDANYTHITVDSALDSSSVNPVQNNVLYAALGNKADSSSVPTKTSDLTNDSNFVSDSDYATVKAQVTTNKNNITSIKSDLSELSKRNYDLEMLGWEVPTDCPIQNDVSGNTFTQKVGRVDLGSLNWTYETTHHYFYPTTSIGHKIPSSTSEVAKLYCQKYITVSQSNFQSNDKCVFTLNSRTGLAIKDSTYTDASAFKSAMNGVYLYFELATYKTITIDGNEVITSIKESLSEVTSIVDGIKRVKLDGDWSSGTASISSLTSGMYLLAITNAGFDSSYYSVYLLMRTSKGGTIQRLGGHSGSTATLNDLTITLSQIGVVYATKIAEYWT